MRKIVSFSTLILRNLPPGKAMILYQMCVAGEVKAIKVNNPATIRGRNVRDCEGIAPHTAGECEEHASRE